MQEHQTIISSVLKIDFGQNFTLKAKECRNIEQFASKNWFWVKFHITNQGMQEPLSVRCRKLEPLSSLHLKINLGPNSTLQDKEWRIIEPLSFCFQKLILGQISHDKPKNAGISNSLLLKIYLGPNSILQCRNIDI